jgi:hypothetical protein
MGWLNLADSDSAFVLNATDKERFSVFRFTG